MVVKSEDDKFNNIFFIANIWWKNEKTDFLLNMYMIELLHLNSDGALGNLQTFCTIVMEDGKYSRELRWSVTEVTREIVFLATPMLHSIADDLKSLKGVIHMKPSNIKQQCEAKSLFSMQCILDDWTKSFKIALFNPNMYNMIFTEFSTDPAKRAVMFYFKILQPVNQKLHHKILVIQYGL